MLTNQNSSNDDYIKRLKMIQLILQIFILIVTGLVVYNFFQPFSDTVTVYKNYSLFQLTEANLIYGDEISNGAFDAIIVAFFAIILILLYTFIKPQFDKQSPKPMVISVIVFLIALAATPWIFGYFSNNKYTDILIAESARPDTTILGTPSVKLEEAITTNVDRFILLNSFIYPLILFILLMSLLRIKYLLFLEQKKNVVIERI